MAQPTPYSRLINFLTYEAAHTSAPYNAADHDAEFNAVETTLDEILVNLALIQRDDGYLRNGSVHAGAFSTAALALIAADWTPRGTWLTSTVYAVGDVVQNSTLSYVCATAHTSGTFNTDYTAGKWIVLGAEPVTVGSSITVSAYGHIAATNLQTFLQELVDEKARLAGSTSQTFDVSDATDDTHAVNAGQIQKQALTHAVAGGSSDALTLTLTSGLTTLSNGMRVSAEALSANAITAPTFNLTLGSTATGAKTIKKGAAQALVAGDIQGAGHKLDLEYYLTGDCWLLLNPAYAPGVSTAGVEPDTVENFGIAFSVGASALTATVKTASGGTPTSSDKVRAALRSSSAATGTYNIREISSTTSLVISSGSTLGHQDTVEGDLHWYLIDNGGTLELAVSSKFFGYSGIVSTTAEGGAGAADTATLMYSSSARSSVSCVWVCATRDSQTTAGTWAATPTVTLLARSPNNAVKALAGNMPVNLSLAASVGSNALTLAIKQADGTDPTQYSPTFIPFRSATAENGDVQWLAVTAAATLVLSNGSTLGTTANIANRFWVVAFNDAGVLRIGAINCLVTSANAGAGRNADSIFALNGWGIASSTAEGGAGAADTAQTFYTSSAVSLKAYTTLGYVTYESGLGTAGVYASSPTRVQPLLVGVALPGQLVQVQISATGSVATGATTLPNDDTIPQNTEGDQYLSQAITPSSAANAIDIEAQLFLSTGAASNQIMTAALFQDSTANAVAAASNTTIQDGPFQTRLKRRLLAGGTSATTFKARAGLGAAGTTTFNGNATARYFGGVANSYLMCTEVMT